MSWRGLAARHVGSRLLSRRRRGQRLRPLPVRSLGRCASRRARCSRSRRIAPSARRAPQCLVRSPADLSPGALRGTCPVRFPADCSAAALRGLVPRPVPADHSTCRPVARSRGPGGRSLGRPHLETTSPTSGIPPAAAVSRCSLRPGVSPGLAPSPVTCAMSSAATPSGARGLAKESGRDSRSTDISTAPGGLSPARPACPPPVHCSIHRRPRRCPAASTIRTGPTRPDRTRSTRLGSPVIAGTGSGDSPARSRSRGRPGIGPRRRTAPSRGRGSRPRPAPGRGRVRPGPRPDAEIGAAAGRGAAR